MLSKKKKKIFESALQMYFQFGMCNLNNDLGHTRTTLQKDGETSDMHADKREKIF